MRSVGQPSPAHPPFARLVPTGTGRWRLWLVSLLLRVLVKWKLGWRIDVGHMRRQQGQLDALIRRKLPAGLLQAASCDGVPAHWLGEAPRTGRVILYLHGGAFVARSPYLHAAMLRGWCEALGARALMVDYRLAPEHPYPAAMEDCHQAYRWLLAQGYQAGQIALAGDSAGGNLALALLHRIKAAGVPLPACAVLLSPFTDFTLSGVSMARNARRDPIFTPAFALMLRSQYVAPERFLDPTVSPLFGDFRGLPPLLIQAGSTEMLLDDAVRVAVRARDAGSHAELEIWERMPHVFQALPLPQAAMASQRIAQFIVGHATASFPSKELESTISNGQSSTSGLSALRP